jgi:hypothetical protein
MHSSLFEPTVRMIEKSPNDYRAVSPLSIAIEKQQSPI